MTSRSRILLVDDEVAIQGAVGPLLRSRGYDVDMAGVVSNNSIDGAWPVSRLTFAPCVRDCSTGVRPGIFVAAVIPPAEKPCAMGPRLAAGMPPQMRTAHLPSPPSRRQRH
jgi:hypothetical protein